ncbi:MAG: response regulator [Gammaproteobacteria bacterium]|nr:response regulator [Gammaproteobacteria bacterium]
MLSILVVEDNLLARTATKFLFKSFTCTLDFAQTGKETLKLLEKKHYDVVFLDLGLPDIEGIELIKKIRKNKKNSHLRIAVLTAHNDPQYKNSSVTAGADRFYTKPLRAENIEEMLSI